jgi:hypothetical protein
MRRRVFSTKGDPQPSRARNAAHYAEARNPAEKSFNLAFGDLTSNSFPVATRNLTIWPQTPALQKQLADLTANSSPVAARKSAVWPHIPSP